MNRIVVIEDSQMLHLQKYFGWDLGMKEPEPDPNSISVVICNKCQAERPNYTGTLAKPFRCTCGYLYGHYKKPYEWFKE